MTTLAEKQTTYDTLLIVGWKKEWNFWKLTKACAERDVDVMEIDRRAFSEGYSGHLPVRAH